jgi:hypothetical protein
MRAEGWLVDHKKIQRLWREEGLRVPVRRRRKKTKNRHAGSAPVAAAPNDVWAIDFCFDATTDAAIKITNIVDEHTRESLDGPMDRSVDADKLVDHLDKLAAVRGFPRYLTVAGGSSRGARIIPRLQWEVVEFLRALNQSTRPCPDQATRIDADMFVKCLQLTKPGYSNYWIALRSAMFNFDTRPEPTPGTGSSFAPASLTKSKWTSAPGSAHPPFA